MEQNAYYCTTLQNVSFMFSAKNKHEKMSVSYLLKCVQLPNVAEGVIKIATDKIRSTAQWYEAKIF